MASSVSFGQWLTLHGVVTLLGLLLYVVTSHAMLLRRGPAGAIAWVLFILLVPYLAVPAYLVFGSRKIRRREAASSSDSRTGGGEGWAIQTALVLGQPPPAACQDLHVHGDGRRARAALLETIAGALRSIDLCTFILRRDVLGESVLQCLCECARRGVTVRVLIDGLGHRMATGPDMGRLVDAGGAWALFSPPMRGLLNGRANLRNHRKLAIADAGTDRARLWCGGRNLGAEYFEGTETTRPWRDLTFDLRGDVVRQAGALFEHDWVLSGPTTSRVSPMHAAAKQRTGGAQLIASGPDQADDTYQTLLLTAAYQARRRILLVTPYFVPDQALLWALCLAARRGVSIQLLVPERSNHRLSDLARNRALRTLALAGGSITLAGGMLHAKLVVVDDMLAMAGSANLDTRSLFLNYEAIMAFHDPEDVQPFAAWFDKDNAGARPYVAHRPGTLRDVAEGLLLWMAFEL